jgi:bacterioferritin
MVSSWSIAGLGGRLEMADRDVLKALRAMLNLEAMAVQIYRAQTWRFRGQQAIADKLDDAIAVEREHRDNLEARMKELGGAAPMLRFAYAIVGWVMGFVPAVLGKIPLLRADIWVEEKAVKDYTAFLDKAPLYDQSRALVEKNIEDEKEHIRYWQESIAILKGTAPAEP